MMSKKEKRKARRKIKKLLQFLTFKEKKALNKARKREPQAIRKKTITRPGIKEWILANKPKRLGTMYERGLLKKVSE